MYSTSEIHTKIDSIKTCKDLALPTSEDWRLVPLQCSSEVPDYKESVSSSLCTDSSYLGMCVSTTRVCVDLFSLAPSAYKLFHTHKDRQCSGEDVY